MEHARQFRYFVILYNAVAYSSFISSKATIHPCKMGQSVKSKVVQSLTCQTLAKQKCLLAKQEITQNADKIFATALCVFRTYNLSTLKLSSVHISDI